MCAFMFKKRGLRSSPNTWLNSRNSFFFKTMLIYLGAIPFMLFCALFESMKQCYQVSDLLLVSSALKYFLAFKKLQ